MKEVVISCETAEKEGRKRYWQVVAVLEMVFSGKANDWTCVNAIAHHHHFHIITPTHHTTIIIIGQTSSFIIITTIISALTKLMTVSPCHSNGRPHTHNNGHSLLGFKATAITVLIQTQWWVIKSGKPACHHNIEPSFWYGQGWEVSRIADSASAEYCPTFQFPCVCVSVTGVTSQFSPS